MHPFDHPVGDQHLLTGLRLSGLFVLAAGASWIYLGCHWISVAPVVAASGLGWGAVMAVLLFYVFSCPVLAGA